VRRYADPSYSSFTTRRNLGSPCRTTGSRRACVRNEFVENARAKAMSPLALGRIDAPGRDALHDTMTCMRSLRVPSQSRACGN